MFLLEINTAYLPRAIFTFATCYKPYHHGNHLIIITVIIIIVTDFIVTITNVSLAIIIVIIIIIELFFCKKKYLLVGAWDMLWTGGSWFMDVCMSHQSDWIYY